MAGLFYKQKHGFFIGTVVGCTARFLVHYVVGATIWAESMPETFFGMTMTTPWFYSALYNGSLHAHRYGSHFNCGRHYGAAPGQLT